MRLSQQTDYAMRVLIYAALQWRTGQLASIQEISRAYGISENHLMKVVHRLGLLQLLETRRGRNGGLRLAQPPETLRLGRLVAELEQDMYLVECESETKGACPLSGMCTFAGALDEAKAAFLRALDNYTLEDAARGTRPNAAGQAVVVWKSQAPVPAARGVATGAARRTKLA